MVWMFPRRTQRGDQSIDGRAESESGAGLDVPAGESGYVERLRERGSEKPTVAGVKALTGKEVGVSEDGTLSCG